MSIFISKIFLQQYTIIISQNYFLINIIEKNTKDEYYQSCRLWDSNWLS